jgi:hypothetical protein
MTTPTIAVVVTSGRKGAVRNIRENGIFGELSRIAMSSEAKTWTGTVTA